MTLSSLLLALLLTQTAPSQPEAPLARAEAASELLEFEEAARLYAQALQEPATRDERLRTYRGLGLTNAFMGRAAEARRAFELLLLMDPEATVPTNLGPKISRPFEAARRAVRRKRPELLLERDRYSGSVFVEVKPDGLPIANLQLVAREQGAKAEKELTRPAADTVAEVAMDPTRNVQTWARALDQAGGVLLEKGSAREPLFFARVAEPPADQQGAAAPPEEATEADAPQETEPLSPAVSSARELSEPDAVTTTVSSSPSRWPWIVGAVGVVGAGVLAGVLLSQPANAGPSLPAADRMERLP